MYEKDVLVVVVRMSEVLLGGRGVGWLFALVRSFSFEGRRLLATSILTLHARTSNLGRNVGVAIQVQKWSSCLHWYTSKVYSTVILPFSQNLIKIVLLCLRRSDRTPHR